MKLLNVRLGPEDAQMAADLRKNGVPISRVVRDAIRAAYQQHAAVRTGHRRASEIMAEIYREHPDPPALTRGTRSRRDRWTVRRVIRERLRRRRS